MLSLTAVFFTYLKGILNPFFAVMNSTELFFFAKMQIGAHPRLEINMINSKMSPDNLY